MLEIWSKIREKPRVKKAGKEKTLHVQQTDSQPMQGLLILFYGIRITENFAFIVSEQKVGAFPAHHVFR